MAVPGSEMPPSEMPPDASPDARARYQRYWERYNWPYTGCGFLWAAVLLLLIYWLLSWLFPSLIPSVY